MDQVLCPVLWRPAHDCSGTKVFGACVWTTRPTIFFGGSHGALGGFPLKLLAIIVSCTHPCRCVLPPPTLGGRMHCCDMNAYPELIGCHVSRCRLLVWLAGIEACRSTCAWSRMKRRCVWLLLSCTAVSHVGPVTRQAGHWWNSKFRGEWSQHLDFSSGWLQ